MARNVITELCFPDSASRAKQVLAAHCAHADHPLVIRGVPLGRAQAVHMRDLARRPEARTYRGHIAISRDLLQREAMEPDIVSDALKNLECSMRTLSVKMWMQPRGNVTPFHFDGNSLCGLNLQLHGRKRWTLVSPRTPLPTLTLSNWARVPANFEPDASQHRCAFVETEPGDLLFVPRYWFHRVEALEPANANLNWIYTPFEPDKATAIGRREYEMVGLLRSLPAVRRIALLASLAPRYGLAEQALADGYAECASSTQKLRRLAIEIASLPASWVRYPGVKAQLRQLRSNNFADQLDGLLRPTGAKP